MRGGVSALPHQRASSAGGDSWDWLTRFDLFPSVEEDARTKTNLGGLVTAITVLIIFLLFLSHTSDYFSLRTTEHIAVDISRGHRLSISVDIVFPSSRCESVHFDVVDSTGEEQIGVESKLTKTRVPSDTPSKIGCKLTGTFSVNKAAGNFHFALGRGVPDTARHTSTLSGPGTISKVGAQHEHVFTLPDLRSFNASHRVNRVAFIHEDESAAEEPQGSTDADSKTAVASTASAAAAAAQLRHHQHHQSTASALGTWWWGRPVQPLDGIHRSVPTGIGQYNYYLNVVPTEFVHLDESVERYYQYSLTKKVVEVHSTAHSFPHPGVFIYYEFSPLMVRITQTDSSFFHYLTQLCALSGSVFVMAQLVEAFIFRLSQKLATAHFTS